MYIIFKALNILFKHYLYLLSVTIQNDVMQGFVWKKTSSA